MKCTKYCPYCTPTPDNRLLNEGTYDLSHIDIKIVGRGRVLRVRSYNINNNVDDDIYETQDCVLIQYCPICGRDLVGVESEIYNRQWRNNNNEEV